MIPVITAYEIKRCSTAITNVRLIASLAKRTKRIEAVQLSEDLVNYIDKFRKYCHINASNGAAVDTYTAFKHDDVTLRSFIWCAEQLPKLKALMTKEYQASQADHYHQVELLFADIIEYLARKTGRIISNAAFKK